MAIFKNLSSGKKGVKKPVAEKEKVKEVTEKKEEPADCHELLFVKDKGWGVRRLGSSKIIKYFPTKVEATEYIVQVSQNNNTSVVIHLKNGKFQKFESAMMALSYAKAAKETD
ncbi:MAG: DUF2188 domain-containing protein [Sphaerochaetaceae bacterium]|nr:DUF2188 domain-containing protein [Sphaerochaetaceae bacterium]